MSNRPWYRRFPSDFIGGTVRLTVEQKGVYATLLDMIWDEGGPIENSPRDLARVCGCRSTRQFNIILADLVKRHRKLYHPEPGLISNRRAEAQMAAEEKEREKRAKSGGKGGKKSAKSREKVASKNQEKTEKKRDGSNKNKDLAENLLGKSREDSPSNTTSTSTSNTLPIGSAPQGASDEELKLYIFNVQLPWLASKAGLKEQRARALLGRWLKDHSPREVVDAVSSAARNQAVDPVPYIVRVLTEGGGSMTEDQRMRRLRKAYPEIPPNYFPDVVQHIRGYFEHGVWTDNWNSFYGGTPDNSRKYDPEGFDPALRPLVERIKNEVRAEARSGSGDKGA